MHTSNLFATRNHLSRHAVTRMQQRSIPAFIVVLLLELTDPVPAEGGCELHRFNADSWSEAKREMGRLASRLDRYRNAYIVVAPDGTVVTAARLH